MVRFLGAGPTGVEHPRFVIKRRFAFFPASGAIFLPRMDVPMSRAQDAQERRLSRPANLNRVAKETPALSTNAAQQGKRASMGCQGYECRESTDVGNGLWLSLLNPAAARAPYRS